MLDAGLREAEGARPAGDSGRGAQAQVTVVIAVWGDYGDDRLDDAIRSIRAQEISVEILLVDNGGDVSSGRGGVSVLRSQTRLTLGAVRNLGLRAVETPTVLFWDADDIMLEGTLRRLLAALEEEPDLVACATSLIDARTGRRHHWPRRWPLHLARVPGMFATLNAVSSLYPCGGAALRSSTARSTGFPDVDSGDDWVMGVSLALRGRIKVIEPPGRLYRRHTGSLSASWKRTDVLAHAKLVRERLREDPCTPPLIRGLVPIIWLGQQLVLRGLRPMSRRLTNRRQTGS